MLDAQKIIFATDFSDTAGAAFLHALRLARRYGADLHVVHVSASPGGAQDVDLVVMGTRGQSGLRRLAMGSVAEAVVRQAPCPVFTVRGKGKEPAEPGAAKEVIARLLVPVDFSESSRLAVAHAKELAASYGAAVDLLHISPHPDLHTGFTTEVEPEGPSRREREHRQRTGHLFSPLPPELRNDTAFMDRIHSYFPGWDVPKLGRAHFTDHFGLVSDFFSECWSHLRSQSRASALQGRVHLGSALSGRDTTAVRKTVSGLLKLLHPDPEEEVPDESLAWAVRLALEGRRRVKEQQKRIGSAEFRNTHFSYRMIGSSIAGGDDAPNDTETFVATPEFRREDEIGSDPLPPGQIWTVSPGGSDEHAGLCRIEVSVGPGSQVRILNRPAPAAFTESVRYAEQNLYSPAGRLVGANRNPRAHSFSVQLRTFGSADGGAGTGVAVLLALCGGLLEESIKGGLVVAGSLNLGGSVDPVHDVTRFAELAVERGAHRLLLPVSARQQLAHLPEGIATELSILFYSSVSDALLKALKS